MQSFSARIIQTYSIHNVMDCDMDCWQNAKQLQRTVFTLAVSMASAVPVKEITTGTASFVLSGFSMTIFAFDCRVKDLIVSPFRPEVMTKINSVILIGSIGLNMSTEYRPLH